MATFFEEQIPVFKRLEETLSAQSYVDIPADWTIVIADVIDSTRAIQEGRYRDINALGGSIIAAVLNAAKPRQIPFVFGGDGASFCVPPQMLDQVKQALKGCQELAEENLQLQLRAGLVPCSDLSLPVRVCRLQRADHLTQFFFIGNGLQEAEHKTKQDQRYLLPENIQANADFTGFECRWNLVPSAKEITFSLLVQSRLPEQPDSLALFRTLTGKLDELIGAESEHHPLASGELTMSYRTDKLRAEVAAKGLHASPLKRFWIGIKIRLENMIGEYWMRKHVSINGYNWGNYRKELIENADYEKLDDIYRCVMSADKKELKQLIGWLENAHRQGKLYYGLHQSDAAIVTCLVSQNHSKHTHFIDSSKGGYALAARQLKEQIRQDEKP
ncbi:DUF3095 family protein [Thiomicrorhabdus sp. 6S3-12]|uniref:DUF3095 family protein n=1 Tax=Thiomicrorhabdus sp. 6S3-12 TaxID=2819681 RepID=UPI001AACC625|nr:DUF3095 family protein [Thiomicrorhabdus sp. 6S3-12]MBO1923571.1 DUF3095 family protein [Thiomicrorhabdus sp. 6S3-12]